MKCELCDNDPIVIYHGQAFCKDHLEKMSIIKGALAELAERDRTILPPKMHYSYMNSRAHEFFGSISN